MLFVFLQKVVSTGFVQARVLVEYRNRIGLVRFGFIAVNFASAHNYSEKQGFN